MLPDEVTPKDLLPSARNELKTLTAENAERVARHMAMAARAIDDDPALAHEHASAAMRHAGRVAVVRETLAITAYATGDFALALRELRTVRRISGRNEHIAMIVDSERGVGRPEKALEEGRNADRTALPVAQRAELAIAMSGARLDLGQAELALHELDIPEADPNRAFEWSPGLFAARAAVLEELGRDDEAAEWSRRARIAGEAIAARLAEDDTVEIHEIAVDAPRDESVRGAGEAHPDDATANSLSDADSGDADSAVQDPAENVGSQGATAAADSAEGDASDAPVADTPIPDAPAVDAEDDAADAAGGASDPEAASPAWGQTDQESTAARLPEDASIEAVADDASFDPGADEPSIEDEVTEILAVAGIIDDADGPHADDDVSEPAPDAGEAEAGDAEPATGASELTADDAPGGADDADAQTASAARSSNATTAAEIPSVSHEGGQDIDEEGDRPDGALF